MSIFVPNKVYLRGILLHYFIQKKSAAEAHRILVQTYGDNALSDTTCRDWFRRFKNNDFELEDKERSGAPKKFEDKELEQLLDEDKDVSETDILNDVLGNVLSRKLQFLSISWKMFCPGSCRSSQYPKKICCSASFFLFYEEGENLHQKGHPSGREDTQRPARYAGFNRPVITKDIPETATYRLKTPPFCVLQHRLKEGTPEPLSCISGYPQSLELLGSFPPYGFTKCYSAA
ncbi:MOS1T transposase, partial [Pseudoatta argentina]